MWTKPWRLTEGFTIGGGLIVTGLMLELSVGPVAWDAFAWPVNVAVVAALLVAMVVMTLVRGRVYAFRFLATGKAAFPAIVYAVALTAVMGVTRQEVGGVGLNDMLSFWPFVLVYAYMVVVLMLAVAARLGRFRWRRDVPFMLNHVGLLVVLVCATVGNADMQRLKLIAAVGVPEWRAVDRHDGVDAMVELPLAVELDSFIMEEYADGSPKRFASEVQIYTQSGKHITATVDVNKPVEVEGWKIYQYGYDTQMGRWSRISIFELVSDPWLPLVYAGIAMMLAGAAAMFVVGSVRDRRLG